ncbi:uncharacterized protein LOC6038503 [Culex quinquefasciatus]|uniref:uncharacterized protein LOC6038503 n=1 Tax=Culex quinquefasciatus TaxID=7176 RepID=UPI0018E30D71|nr:uncharacterized protein LOC6038503 [Culex quinquefasciatus]
MDRIASLPPELLANIFKFLSGNALRQVRLVCHRWRCVVSSYRALATRLALRLKRGNGKGSYWMGQNFQPPPLVPVSSFAFVCWGIEGVDGWWPAFGRKLTVLTMTACTVRFEVFVAMLRVTPNLKCLELDVMSFEGSRPVAPDFRLEHVEKLWMIRVYCEAFSVEDVIEVLTVMCPRVKDFAMRMLVGMEILQKVMRRFETTLEKFQVKVKRRENDLKAYPIEQHPPENLVADMCILQGLRLKRVSMDVSDPFDEKDWKRLIQAQPDIEELILYVDFSWRLKRIAELTPKIRVLELHPVCIMNLQYLNSFQQLEFLKVHGNNLGNDPIHDVLFHPRLKELHLRSVHLVHFLYYLQQCTLLEHIQLEDCRFENRIIAPTTFPNLRNLALHYCNVDRKVLLFIFNGSPRLEQVRLSRMDHVDDQVVEVLCRRATGLWKLELNQVGVTDIGGMCIIQYAHSLEELRLIETECSMHVIEILQRTRNLRVRFSVPRVSSFFNI